MDPLTQDAIVRLIASERKRPSYIAHLLEFQLGREPTQEEVDAVNHDNELRRLAHKKWLAMQPWNVRKRHVDRADRIRLVLKKRYNVPDSLVQMLIDEYTDNDW